MIMKIHEVNGEIIVALCDDKLLGKKLGTFKVGRFYNGKKTSAEEVLATLKSATIINAIGKETVEFLIQNNFIDRNSITYIENEPHAQMVKVWTNQ